MVCRDGKVFYSAGSLYLLTITMSSCQAEIRWSVWIWKFLRIFASHSQERSVHIPLVRRVKFKLLALLLFYSWESFSRQGMLMVSHRSLRDSTSREDSRTLFSTSEDHKNIGKVIYESLSSSKGSVSYTIILKTFQIGVTHSS